MAKARQECTDFNGAELEVASDFVTRVELTGDGKDDEVIDRGGLYCPGVATLFCGGSAGCPITFVADGATSDFYAQGWTVVDWEDQRVILLAVHGSECGEMGAFLYRNPRRRLP